MKNSLTTLRMIRRLTLLAILTIILFPFQIIWVLPSILLNRLPRFQGPIARLWFRSVVRIFNIKVTIVNKRSLSKKQKIFLSNHISYMDIPILGAYFNCFFIAKSDIAGWPIFGILSKLAGTIFVTRHRRFLKSQLAQMNKHLNAKQSLMIFPEGTTNTGQEILRFKSGLLNSVFELKKKPVIQPLSLIYTHVNEKRLETQEDFDQIAWYGDMTMKPHFLHLLKQKNFRARVVIHPAMIVTPEDDAKKIALQAYNTVKSIFE